MLFLEILIKERNDTASFLVNPVRDRSDFIVSFRCAPSETVPTPDDRIPSDPFHGVIGNGINRVFRIRTGKLRIVGDSAVFILVIAEGRLEVSFPRGGCGFRTGETVRFSIASHTFGHLIEHFRIHPRTCAAVENPECPCKIAVRQLIRILRIIERKAEIPSPVLSHRIRFLRVGELHLKNDITESAPVGASFPGHGKYQVLLLLFEHDSPVIVDAVSVIEASERRIGRRAGVVAGVNDKSEKAVSVNRTEGIQVLSFTLVVGIFRRGEVGNSSELHIIAYDSRLGINRLLEVQVRRCLHSVAHLLSGDTEKFHLEIGKDDRVISVRIAHCNTVLKIQIRIPLSALAEAAVQRIAEVLLREAAFAPGRHIVQPAGSARGGIA